MIRYLERIHITDETPADCATIVVQGALNGDAKHGKLWKKKRCNSKVSALVFLGPFFTVHIFMFQCYSILSITCLL
jgi:hypothetical protein